MPNLTSESFPIQIRSNFKILSEFFNISSLSSKSIWSKFIFSKEYFIFMTIRLNKIVIFLKKLKMFSLFNIIRNDSSEIELLKISSTGTKISFVVKKKNLIIFKLMKKKDKFKKNNWKFFFNKIFEFSCDTEKSTFLISTSFNNDENVLLLSFSNGKILFLNFNGKILTILKMDSPIFCLSPGIGIKSNFEFYGILNKNFLIVYNLQNKRFKNFKSSRKYIIRKNFIISFENTCLEIYCTCHQKILKKFTFSWEIKEILPIEENKILIRGNNSIFFLNLGNFFLKCTKFYYFEKGISKEILFNLNDHFLFQDQQYIFSVLAKLTSNRYLEIKPLTEKINFIVHSNTMILKNIQINSVKFFGKKNSIIAGDKINFVNIFNGSCFRFIGTFFINDVIITDIIIRNNLFLFVGDYKEIFVFNYNNLTLLQKIQYLEKVSVDFSISNERSPQNYLACGLKNGILKIWILFIRNLTKTQLKLIWSKNLTNDPLISVSISWGCKFIACLSGKKEIFLCKIKNFDFSEKIESVEKKTNFLKFCPKTKILCAGTEYGSVIFFDISTGTLIKTIKGDGSPVLKISFNNEGSILCAGFKDGTIKILSIYNTSIFNVLANHNKPILGSGFSEDEKIISGCLGGRIIIFKDTSYENCEKQDTKFSKIFLLKKFLKINNSEENFNQIFERLVFTKNPFMLIDFLDFSFKKDPVVFQKIFSRAIIDSDIRKLSFILKSLILWNQIKKEQCFVYRLILILLDNIKPKEILKIDFAILKGANRIIREWISNINRVQELSLKLSKN